MMSFTKRMAENCEKRVKRMLTIYLTTQQGADAPSTIRSGGPRLGMHAFSHNVLMRHPCSEAYW